MYKILHKLFGWDYIFWENFADRGVARVYKSEDGIVWYWRYKNTHVIDEISNPNQVIWLTCHHNKYFVEEVL